jgi:predicted NAD/FAD-dependent oxidoreductase
VAVVGAGMAGASCAVELQRRGAFVQLFDKGRDVGGRLAQRRSLHAVFDHGAQYLSAADETFRGVVAGWVAAGCCAPWPGVAAASGVPVMVGTPAMSAPIKYMLGALPVALQAEVTALRRSEEGWAMDFASGVTAGPFDAVVLAVPAPQAAALLLRSGLAGAAAELELVRMAPCWAGLATYARSTGRVGAVRLGADDGLVWAARNDTKPGRGGIETWTFHAGPGWSERWLEADLEELTPRFAALVADSLGPELGGMTTLTLHRWRYALVTRPFGVPCLLFAGGSLGLCGDWCLGPRVEAAWLSGSALGRELPL